jgi:hypothetical protein
LTTVQSVSENTGNSNLFDRFKNSIMWIFAILGIILAIVPFVLVGISGHGLSNSSLQLFISWSGLFTVSATLFLVCITIYYANATKKMADSTQHMATLTQSNIDNTKETIKVMNETKYHQVLTNIQTDYRSPEMMLAISGLWDFYRKCENLHKEKHLKIDFEKYLKGQFIRRYNKEKKEIDRTELNVVDSLNYKRRLLTHFYSHLASLHVHEILPENMIFDWWKPNDLKMIDKFIIPLQEAVDKKFGHTKKELYVFKKHLKKLKEDCDSYYKNMQTN